MKEVKLKHLVSLIKDQRPFDSNDRYLGLENMASWTGAYRWAEDPDVKSLVGVFQKGDILFGKLRPNLAKVVSPAESGVCSTEVLILRPSGQVDRDFLRYVLTAQHFIDRVSAAAFGGRMPRSSWENIGSEKILLPDFPTQKIITDFLDREIKKLNETIEKIFTQVERLFEFRSTLITRAVNGHIDVTKWDNTARGLDHIEEKAST